MLADKLAEVLKAGPWKFWHETGEYAKAEYKGSEFFIIKPTTYMNDSGRMVQSFSHFYKIQPQNILVCFDDISINCSTVRVRASGSSGGQNGMRSIIDMLGTQAIPRLRIGTGPCPPNRDTKDFVLSGFSPDDKALFSQGLGLALQAALLAVSDGIEKAMNRFNAPAQKECK